MLLKCSHVLLLDLEETVTRPRVCVQWHRAEFSTFRDCVGHHVNPPNDREVLIAQDYFKARDCSSSRKTTHDNQTHL